MLPSHGVNGQLGSTYSFTQGLYSDRRPTLETGQTYGDCQCCSTNQSGCCLMMFWIATGSFPDELRPRFHEVMML
jgi:hypothetical protein